MSIYLLSVFLFFLITSCVVLLSVSLLFRAEFKLVAKEIGSILKRKKLGKNEIKANSKCISGVELDSSFNNIALLKVVNFVGYLPDFDFAETSRSLSVSSGIQTLSKLRKMPTFSHFELSSNSMLKGRMAETYSYEYV